MSYGWNSDPNGPPQQSAADLATSFLNSVGQQLQENPYGHDAHSRYKEEIDYRGEEYYRREGSRDMDTRDRHHNSRDRYRDRSRDRRRRSRERRERSPRHHRRNSRDEYRNRRRRSPSPRRSRRHSRSPRRRDEDIVPLSKRMRKLQNWDMAPAGMEGMSAEQVKMTGLFPLPGQVLGTRAPQSFQPPPPRHDPRSAAPVVPDPLTAKQAKRIYVGQIPFGIDERPIADFFNSTMQKFGFSRGPSVLSVQINHDKNYAFVDFESPDQATSAMGFDGVMFQGQQLKIRRPKDYQPPAEGDDHSQLPGFIATNVADTPNKIFIGGLPVYLNEEQVVELLKSFGELRSFNLVKDPLNGTNKGYAFCEYADPGVTDLACQGLNNMELGDRKLIVQRASIGAKQGVIPADYAIAVEQPMETLTITGAKEEDATRVLQLMNMVTPEELEDDEEFNEIWEDIAEECSKFGTVIDMKIPRPNHGEHVPGLGLIFVRFETKDQSLSALRALAGRKFAERTVVTSFVEEDNYLNGIF